MPGPTCRVEGCDGAKYVTPGGFRASYCPEHIRSRSRATYGRRRIMAGRPGRISTYGQGLCVCGQPRRWKSGYCPPCDREYRRLRRRGFTGGLKRAGVDIAGAPSLDWLREGVTPSPVSLPVTLVGWVSERPSVWH